MSYRTRYRKNPRKSRVQDGGWGLKVFLVFILCSALLFAAAILLGNYLKMTADGGPYPDAPLNTTEALDVPAFFNVSNVPVIIGEYRTLNSVLGLDDPETDNKVSGKSAVEYSATTLLLRVSQKKDTAETTTQTEVTSRRQTGMRLLYSSDLSIGASFDSVGTENIAKVLGEAKTKYNYVSGLFEVMFFDEPDSSQSLMREYEIGLLCELSECGLDDVVLTGFSSENLTLAVKFVREVAQKTNGKLKVGIALPFDYFESADVRSNIKALNYDCGFLAMDLRDSTIPSLMSSTDFVFDRVGRIASTVSLFSVRVIVGCADAGSYKSEVDAAFKAGALNIQACARQ